MAAPAAAAVAAAVLPRSSSPRGRRPQHHASSFRCAGPSARPSALVSSSKSRGAGRHSRIRPQSSQQQAAEVAAGSSSSVDDDGACELVSGSDLVIGDGDDSVRAYLFKAVKNNNGTGILLLSDVFGFEDSATRDFAYRVACNGYNVLVPDLFRGNPWKPNLPSDGEGYEQWRAGHAPGRVAGDIDACTRWLVEEFKAAGVSGKLGAIGFCYGGGRLVETLARDADRCFSAGVCFYGTRMDAAALGGGRAVVAAPVLFVCGDADPLCPVATVRELERRVAGARVIVYAGRGHGFAHRPQSVEEDADAEHAFNAMRAWLHDHLLA